MHTQASALVVLASNILATTTASDAHHKSPFHAPGHASGHSSNVQADVSKSYDVIVVGAGATGIVAATKFAEAGKSTLLLEAGGPSLWADGGRTQSAAWKGTTYGIHDVLSFIRSMWSDEYAPAIFDPDVGSGVEAALVLGGGTAVNAAQQLVPPKHYWDTYMPEGWNFEAIKPYIEKMQKRMPTSSSTNADGKTYASPDVFRVMTSLFTNMGYKQLSDVNDIENVAQDRGGTFGRQAYVSHDGQRGGPMVSYLRDATKLPNFKLQMHTKIIDLIRNGDEVSGLRASYNGQNVTYTAKNIVLAAGVFNTAKILFKSGIGPKDTLTSLSTAQKLSIPEKDWILNEAVGRNVHDNPSFEFKLLSPGVTSVNHSLPFEAPNPAEKEQFLKTHSGPLTTPEHVGVFWLKQARSDGKGDMYISGACGADNPYREWFNRWMCKFSLNEGTESRGKFTLDPISDKVGFAETGPWSTSEIDVDTHAAAIVSFRTSIDKFNTQGGNVTVTFPKCTDKASCVDWINGLKADKSWSGDRHWGGSAKLGHDDATKGGNSAVDANTLKVFGTSNLFVVDGSLSPAPTTSNPACFYEIVAEAGSDRMLKAFKA